MAQLFSAMYRGRDDENRHMVSLGKDHPVTYVMDENHQIFKLGFNKKLSLVSDEVHAKYPWIRSSIFQAIRRNAASNARSAIESRRRKQNRFFA